MSYERSMQEDVVWIAARKISLPNSILACLARASLKTSYYVYFRDEAEQARYWLVYSKIEQELDIVDAVAWLQARGLLASMPRPKAGAPLADYARAVEAFCGVQQGALLAVLNETTMTFAKGGLGRITSGGIADVAATNEQFECVMRVISAADLPSSGIFFGFVGNEASKGR